MVAPPQSAETLAGERLGEEAMDLTVRVISNRQPHLAVPLSTAMCIAVAAQIEGTLAQRAARAAVGETGEATAGAGSVLRLAHPSGITPLSAAVSKTAAGWRADHVSVFRTARRLMEGAVLVPAGVFPPASSVAQPAQRSLDPGKGV